MNSVPILLRCVTTNTTPVLRVGVARLSDIIDRPDDPTIKIPVYSRENETLENRKARLLYQSRKRGMLENDLLLSTFAGKYLKNMTEEQVNQYDNMINKPSNDWEIYYWGTGMKPIPKEFDNEVMRLFVEHVKTGNKKGQPMRQPNI